jgi:hypothetical protein
VPEQLEVGATQAPEQPQLEAIGAAARAPTEQVGALVGAGLAALELLAAAAGRLKGPLARCWAAMRGSSSPAAPGGGSSARRG